MPVGRETAGAVVAWWVGWWLLHRVVRAALRPVLSAPSRRKVFPDEKSISVAAANVVASVHAALGFAASAYVLSSYVSVAHAMSPDSADPAKFGGPGRAAVARVLEVTAGYMGYDLVEMCTVDGAIRAKEARKNAAMIGHHACIIIGYPLCIEYGVGGYIALMLEVAELSTPLYHVRWFLIQFGYDEATSRVTQATSVLFFFLFLAVRGFYYVALAAFPVRHYVVRAAGTLAPVDVVAGVITALFILLNWYWCYLAVAKMVGVIRGDPAAFKRSAAPEKTRKDA